MVITSSAAHLDPSILVTQADSIFGTVCDIVVITLSANTLNPTIHVTKADSLRGTVCDFVVITCGEAHI